MGMQKMTKEHIGLCLFLKIPFFIVVTKVDLAPQNKYEETITELKKLLKHKLLNKFPMEVKESTTDNEIQKMAELMPSGNMCPIFPISSISKLGFGHLIDFIYKLEKRETKTYEETSKQPFEFEIN